MGVEIVRLYSPHKVREVAAGVRSYVSILVMFPRSIEIDGLDRHHQKIGSPQDRVPRASPEISCAQ
jgi:hypothetical protein